MKKIIALTLFVGATLCFYSFNNNSESTSSKVGEESKISSSEIWEHMNKKVFPELEDLVGYNKKEKLFSRCPSGFSQHKSEEKSNEEFVYGTITFAEGCSREEYCFYKIDWKTKDTKLKKKEKDDFVAISTFVKTESQKVAKT